MSHLGIDDGLGFPVNLHFLECPKSNWRILGMDDEERKYNLECYLLKFLLILSKQINKRIVILRLYLCYSIIDN